MHQLHFTLFHEFFPTDLARLESARDLESALRADLLSEFNSDSLPALLGEMASYKFVQKELKRIAPDITRKEILLHAEAYLGKLAASAD